MKKRKFLSGSACLTALFLCRLLFASCADSEFVPTESIHHFPEETDIQAEQTETSRTESEQQTESTETDIQPAESEEETTQESESETSEDTESESETTPAEGYFEQLIQEGFPSSYARPLAELQAQHPTWEFVPLFVTELNSKYTWNYVLEQELAVAERNLVPAEEIYRPYFRQEDENLYDSGYRAASYGCVAYFMDPRNFFNETEIFQFFDVSLTPTDVVDSDALSAILAGSFMEAQLPGSEQTYQALFTELGESLGIRPIYLAIRGRLEQGILSPSATGSGTCGTALSLLTEKDYSAWNGYYNFYNIGAAGTGKETILRQAVARAMQGSNGDPWNTLEKSIRGGAEVLRQRFITNYQNTPYLLKFNVDARSLSQTGTSRNFWGQYTQNIFSAWAEGRSLAKAFATAGCTEGDYRFLIPVYAQMPETPCPDPGKSSNYNP